MSFEVPLRRIPFRLHANYRACISSGGTARSLLRESWNSETPISKKPGNKRFSLFWLRRRLGGWSGKEETRIIQQNDPSNDLWESSIATTHGTWEDINNELVKPVDAVAVRKTANALKLQTKDAAGLCPDSTTRVPFPEGDHIEAVDACGLSRAQKDAQTRSTVETSNAGIAVASGNERVHDTSSFPVQSIIDKAPQASEKMQLVKSVSSHETSEYLRTGRIGLGLSRAFILQWRSVLILTPLLVYLTLRPIGTVKMGQRRPSQARNYHKIFDRNSLMLQAVNRVYCHCNSMILKMGTGTHNSNWLNGDTRALELPLNQNFGWKAFRQVLSNPTFTMTKRTIPAEVLEIVPAELGTMSSFLESESRAHEMQTYQTVAAPRTTLTTRLPVSLPTALLRIIQFAEALDVLRFHDAATLHIDSVVAGFWNDRFRLVAPERHMDKLRGWSLLISYLMLRPVVKTLPQLTKAHSALVMQYCNRSPFSTVAGQADPWMAKKVQEHEFMLLFSHGIFNDTTAAAFVLCSLSPAREFTTAAHIHSLSTSITRSRNLSCDHMPWMHLLELLPKPSDKIEGAIALSELLRHHILLTKRSRSTLPRQDVERRRLLRRLQVLYFHERYVREYEQHIRASDGFLGAVPTGKVPMTGRLLPNSIERSLAKGEYMERGWLARVAPTLPTDQQTRLFLETIRRLLVQAHQHRRIGTRMGLQRRSILALIRDAERLYRQLRLRGGASVDAGILRRTRNPFTGVSHSSLEEEIRETERWRAVESSHYQEVMERLRSDTALDDVSRRTLNQQYRISSLKLFKARDHLRGLRLERTPLPSAGSTTETDNQQTGYGKPQGSTLSASNTVKVPYAAQHYMLGDIYDRFKRALFLFGQREMPKLMRQKGWDDPEGLSLKEFENLMDQDENWRNIYQLFKDRFESLRLIRNAYAHESNEMNMDHLEGLFVDAKFVAQILGQTSLIPLIEKYEEHLAIYSKRYLDSGVRAQRKLRYELMATEKGRHASLKQLVSSKDKRLARRLDLRAEELHIHRSFDELEAKLKNDYRSFESYLVQELKEFSLASSIRYRLGLGRSLWAARLVQTLSEEHTTTKKNPGTLPNIKTTGATQERSNSTKISTSSPRTWQAGNAIPPLRLAVRTLETGSMNKAPSLQRKYLSKSSNQVRVSMKQQILRRQGQDNTVNSTGQKKVKEHSPFGKLGVGGQTGMNGRLKQVRDNDKESKPLSRPKHAVDADATKKTSQNSKVRRMRSHNNVVRHCLTRLIRTVRSGAQRADLPPSG